MMEAEEAERIINEPGPAPAAAASNQLTAQEQMMLENATASADSMAEWPGKQVLMGAGVMGGISGMLIKTGKGEKIRSLALKSRLGNVF